MNKDSLSSRILDSRNMLWLFSELLDGGTSEVLELGLGSRIALGRIFTNLADDLGEIQDEVEKLEEATAGGQDAEQEEDGP